VKNAKCFETLYDLDESLGMKCYLTYPELYIKPSGKLNDRIFKVYELLNQLGLASPKYIYKSEYNVNYYHHSKPLYLYLLRKRNMDTLEVVKALRRILGTQKIIYLGLKDKAAETYQFIFVQGDKYFTPYINKGSIELIFVALLPKRNKNDLRDLLVGNCFNIDLNGLANDHNEVLEEIMNKISEIGFLPNYYSYQRFGVERSITHILGKYLLVGDLENFISTLICYPDNKCDLAERCRSVINMRGWMWVERIVCRRLLKGDKDYLKILSSIPREILGLYASAYISYIFNHYLSERWRFYGLGYDAIDGELTEKGFFIDKGIPYLHFVIKRSGELEIYSGHKEILREIFQKELSKHNMILFPDKIRDIIGVNKIVMRRNLISPIYDLRVRNRLEISFCLDKGGYATNLLRELFKYNIKELF
jgi:tRNA pseudouridine13 synthase